MILLIEIPRKRMKLRSNGKYKEAEWGLESSWPWLMAICIVLYSRFIFYLLILPHLCHLSDSPATGITLIDIMP